MSQFRCFQTSQENQYSSDRTNGIRAKTIYSNVGNLAQNGGVWQKADGSVYTGNVYLGRQSSDASLCLVHADNHADLLDVTKGKYLTTPRQQVSSIKTREYIMLHILFLIRTGCMLLMLLMVLPAVIIHLSIHQHVHLVTQGPISSILRILRM